MMKKNTTVENLRARLLALAAEDKALQTQSHGRDDVRAAIVTRVEGMSHEWHGRVDLLASCLAAGHGAVGAFGPLFSPQRPNGGIDAVAVVGLLGVDTVVNALQARIADVVPEGPDRAARAARRAEIARERIEVQREEERLICASEAAGHPILRRPEADPAIVLELVGDAADTAAGDAPEPTPPHVIEEQQEAAVSAKRRAAAAERLAAASEPVPSQYMRRSRS